MPGVPASTLPEMSPEAVALLAACMAPLWITLEQASERGRSQYASPKFKREKGKREAYSKVGAAIAPSSLPKKRATRTKGTRPFIVGSWLEPHEMERLAGLLDRVLAELLVRD